MTLTDLFLRISRMSGIALASAMGVMLLSLLLCWWKRVPKRFYCAMLLIVVFRLMCPVSVSTPLSIFNSRLVTEYAQHCVPLRENMGLVGDYEVAFPWDEEYEDCAAAGLEVRKLLPERESSITYYTYKVDENGHIIPATSFIDLYGHKMAVGWLIGAAVLLLYGAVSYLILRRRVSTATLAGDNIYESDRIKTPFILGYVRPKIYIPLGLSEEQRRHVAEHEREHIRHGDHILKLIVYILMCVHWFNLLLWTYFYRLFVVELEEACDSGVIERLGEESAAPYSETLLALFGRHFIGAVPCAFGESSAKGRVQSVLKYRRPNFAAKLISALVFICALVLCATNAMP